MSTKTLLEIWKKLWNIKVTVMPIVNGAFGTVTKGLIQGLEDLEIRGRVETLQTTALLRRSEYWEKSRGLEETCCYSDSSEKPSTNADVKNFQGVKITINNSLMTNNIKATIDWNARELQG